MAIKSSPPNPPAKSARRRLWIFCGLLALWLFVICCRLVQLQIFQYGDYIKRAERQQQRSIEVAPQRGVIYDRDGQPLAMSALVDSAFAVPSELPDPQNTASLLGRILHQDPQEILARLSASRGFCWIARKLDPQTAGRIRDLNLKGIYFQKEPKRFYPKRELAAQVLGYVGLDDEGLGGIEREYDDELRGKPGRMLISMDARRKWLGRIERQPEPGTNLLLTIDQRIQYIAERELAAAVQQTQAQAGTVIVQDPHTGEILALANRPTFDPNLFSKSSQASLNDRAVSDIYEPGSTFKIVTVAAALDEKVVRPEDVIDCQMGSIELAGHIIHDHKAYGDLSIGGIIANSSDVGAIKVALRLGDERFDHYIRAFGFGSQTGIELPGETRGLTKPVSRWSKISIGAISMGQEIGVSALQLVSMISTIANDGVYNAPRVVAGPLTPATDPKLRTVVFHPDDQHRIISTLTAAEMKKMLEGVVLFGTGKKALLDGYTSAGKTGTAQKIDPATGRYSHSNYIASFAGFAPVNNPAATIIVILDSPKGGHEGGQVAAPVFARIAEQVLTYMNVRHDAEISDKRRMLLRAAAKAPATEVTDSPETLEEEPQLAVIQPPKESPAQPMAELKPTAFQKKPSTTPERASAPEERQMPASTQNGTVVVEVGGGVSVPSLIGLPMREALERAEEAGLELDIAGSGTARDQMPAPGARVPPGGHIAVTFAH